MKRYRETGGYGSRKRSGRPSGTSARDDNAIHRLVKQKPFITSPEIKQELPFLRITPRTIRHRLLTKLNLRSRKPARKPYLNAKQMKMRLDFCKKYRKLTKDQWNDVMFSDESTFQQFGIRRTVVRRPPNTRYSCKYTVPMMKHPEKVMIWGCFSAAGRGSIHFVPKNETVNAQRYIRILESKLLPFLPIHGTTTFQQDSAPCHTAKSVKSWLQKKKIKLLDWPGNSPDLNPIENLWELLKRRVVRRAPKNMQDLTFFIKYTWCREITPDLCRKLAHTMPQRIATVLKAKGQPTKY